MPKPIAYVTWSSDSRIGRVSIETPETDTDRAHRAQVVAAVMVASDGWGTVAQDMTSHATIRLDCPPTRRLGGGALREAAKYTTQDARDAAKAALRAAGYTVRVS